MNSRNIFLTILGLIGIYLRSIDANEAAAPTTLESTRAQDGEHGEDGCQYVNGQNGKNGQNGMKDQDGGHGGNGGDAD